MAEELYVKYEDGEPVAYAYGEEWVAMALYMDDISYATPEEAKLAWIAGHPDKIGGKNEAADRGPAEVLQGEQPSDLSPSAP